MTQHSREHYEPGEIPFQHVKVNEVLGDGATQEIVSVLREQQWCREAGDAHSFWSGKPVLATETALLRHALRFERHRLALQDCLGVDLRKAPLFDVFKLSDGDGIGFHDDASIPCVRLATKIHQDKRRSVGGDFLMSNGSLDSIYISELDVDSGVAFSSGLGRLHAVSSIKGSDAIFLIAQYEIAGL
jgi:hypothetical protein